MSLIVIEGKAQFEEELKKAGSKLVVVDFYADWCGPCRMIAPKLKEIAEADPDIVVLKVNVDNNEELSQKYEVSGIPHFCFFKDEKQVGSFSGANEAKLKETIANLK